MVTALRTKPEQLPAGADAEMVDFCSAGSPILHG
jgi:hypothetical protein